MKLTNKMHLPEPIVRAVANDSYTKGDADFSVTELLLPPQIARLSIQHDADIEEDASDRIWSLLGQAVHSIIERAAADDPTSLSEFTIIIEIDGVKIKGTLDHIVVTFRKLNDFKVTTAWKLKGGEIPAEWIAQTNIYRYLLKHKHGLNLESMSIIAILRDWSKLEAARNPDYPQAQVMELVIPLWTYEDTLAFIRQRILLHTFNPPPPCSDEEIWAKPSKWALMKKNRATAVRLFNSQAEADAALQVAGSMHYIEYRPGVATRCQHYCKVAPFCPQWKNDPRNKPSIAEELFA